KVKSEDRSTRTESGNQNGAAKHSGYNYDFPSAAQYIDCPGCPKCSPNGGYILRKGSWRPARSFEYIYMLTKSDCYYGDGEAVKSEYKFNRWGGEHYAGGLIKYQNHEDNGLSRERSVYPGTGANLRNVWNFPATASYNSPLVDLRHFAAFPERLPEICIKASTSEHGVCDKCGAPWARVIDKLEPPDNVFTKTKCPNDGLVSGHRKNGEYRGSGEKFQQWTEAHPGNTLGWRPTCKCKGAGVISASVLDPFAGSGTVLKVAADLGRRSVGYELSEPYCRLIVERNKQGVIL
ncbi:MAG: site-specific DNA-methyltransferase, partial [Methylobacter tundripaludum]|nr:site-specific DNA-methyltransferase [Methylobacter tundripaludum]